MKRTTLILKVFIVILLTTFIHINTYAQQNSLERANHYLNLKGELTFSFIINDPSEISQFSSELSIVNYNPQKRELIVWANERQFSKFLARGIDFQVLESENQIVPVTMSNEVKSDYMAKMSNTLAFPLTAYPTYADYAQQMQDFQNDYPTLCQIVDIGGTTEGVGGGNKRLLFAKISANVSVDQQEPRMMYTSSMHGDEIAGYPMMLELINYLLTVYNDTGHPDHLRIKNILDNSEIWINPSANPDGTYYNSPSNTSVASSRRANANGWDLNRNYPDNVAGPHADGNSNYELETQHFMNLADTYHFVLSANFHGGTEVVNYPWDNTYTRHPDDDWFFFISKEYAQNCQNAELAYSGTSNYMDAVYTGSTFPGVTNGADWYRVEGGRQDYMNYYQQCKESTIELSNVKILSPSLLTAHWNYNKEALIEYLIQGTYGFRGVVKDAVTGDPIDATVTLVGHDALGSHTVTEINHGDYYRPTIAGTYDILFQADCYESFTLSSQTIANYETKVLTDVLLTPIAVNAPSNLVASNIAATTATISWNSITGANYDYQYRAVGSLTWTTVSSSNSSINLTSLTQSTQYEVQVRSTCGGNTSPYSTSILFTTTTPPPCSGTLVTSFPYSESFESGIGDWYQSTTDNFDWTRNSGNTITGSTGPNAASDGNWYMYTETDTSTGIAIFNSPCFNLNGKSNASFSYDYSMYGSNTGLLSLEISTNDGTTWTSIWSLSGDQGTAWYTNTINLDTYVNNYVRLRFTADMPNTGAKRSDIAIDKIGLSAVSAAITWYQDLDNDTFGNPAVSQVSVSQPLGYVNNNTDCDDNNDTINPDTVWYIGVDGDGDGFFGSTSSVTQCASPGAGYSTTAQTTDDCDDADDTINPDTVWYIGVDSDGDGFFGSTSSVTQCAAPGAGYSTTAQITDDCDDADDTINPDTVWYIGVDGDGDGFFGSTSSVTQCASPGAGYSTTAQTTDDCDDADDTINPDTVWYIGVDSDGDGFFGSTSSVTQCASPGAGYSTTAQTTDDCDDADDTINPDTVWYIGVDGDGDGFFGSTSSVTQCASPGAGYSTTAQTTDDCDDADDTINPDTVWYIGVDSDGDGFFGSTSSVTQCAAPGAGYSTTAQTTNDCNDADDTINPDTVWYIGVDGDGDGFFGSTSSVTQCASPGAGYSTTAQTTDDCDDADDTINPDTVWYIGVDSDGDGFFGSTSSVTQCASPGAGYSTTAQTTDDCDDADDTINPDTVWYIGVDSDGDGFFGSTSSVTQCASPGAGYSTTAQTTDDCNDADDTINPDTVWYIGVDGDGDGFFGSTSSVTQCASPGAGYSTTAQTTDDCDDADDTINPDTVWYIGVDSDGDGFFGSTSSVTQCAAPGAGYSTTAQTTDDCDDADDTINPDTVWYIGVDGDGDGFFGSTSSVTQCASPGAGYSTTAQTTDDCDDADDTINPDTVWYIGVDSDGDGFFGSTSSVTQCASPGAGYSTTAQITDDCDDADDTINPDTVWYIGVDGDGDGFFGSTSSVTQCASPGAGYSTTAQTTDDCDDADDTINPDTVWYIGVDSDGDGFFGSTSSVTQCASPGAGYSTTAQTTDDCDDADDTINPDTVWYIGVDGDGDGFFGSTSSVTQCASPGAGYSTTAQTTDDCDDADDTINPDTVWYIGVDSDGDGFFGSTSSVTQCASPGAGYSTTAQTTNDCDDADDTINPGATEVCDGVDNNCDGNIDEGLTFVTYYADTDNDTFGDAGNSVTTCDSVPAGYVTNDTDCDDTNSAIYPGATEIPDNGIDEDCDGFDDITLSSKDFDIKNVTIKPNPFQNSITINVPLVFNNSDFDIKIFDLNGRLVFNKIYISLNNRVLINNLDHLEQASYLIKITNIKNGISVIKKLIKF